MQYDFLSWSQICFGMINGHFGSVCVKFLEIDYLNWTNLVDLYMEGSAGYWFDGLGWCQWQYVDFQP